MTKQLITLDLNGVNSYLYKNGEQFTLIDTGGPLILDKENTNRRQLLQDKLTENGCNSTNLSLILLTHGDMDHVWNALYFSKLYDSPIGMHSGDLPLTDQPTLDVVAQSFQYHSLTFKVVFRLMKKKILAKTEKTMKEFESFSPDIFLDTNPDLSRYGFDGAIINTPGHTPGSIGILFDNGDFICGDTLTCGKKPSLGINSFDYKTMKITANELKKLSIVKIYPGHGIPFDAIEFF